MLNVKRITMPVMFGYLTGAQTFSSQIPSLSGIAGCNSPALVVLDERQQVVDFSFCSALTGVEFTLLRDNGINFSCRAREIEVIGKEPMTLYPGHDNIYVKGHSNTIWEIPCQMFNNSQSTHTAELIDVSDICECDRSA